LDSKDGVQDEPCDETIKNLLVINLLESREDTGGGAGEVIEDLEGNMSAFESDHTGNTL
jgi:hypothetical protein